MRTNVRGRAAIIGLLLLTGSAAWAEMDVQWEPFTGATRDGRPVPGRLGRIRVPENRARPDGPTIELAFVHYRTTHPNPGPPVFFLAGGPGGSGVDLCATVATHPQVRLLEHADVIGIDQRGTGRSGAALVERAFVRTLPLDRAPDRDDVVGALRAAAAECADTWTSEGVDLGAYTTVESADDIDAVRRALGLERIVLYGSSYGSHLGLAYLRRHADAVARAVLMKVEGPDDTWKLPSTVQRHLEAVDARAARDPRVSARLPDLLGCVRTLLTRLEAEPVRVDFDDGTSIVIGAYDLQCVLSRALASADAVAELPAELDRCMRGDWTTLAEAALEDRRIVVNGMTLMMDCASGATPARRARIEQERVDPANLLSDGITAWYYPEGCEACGNPDLGDAFRTPFACAVPVLFVSGTLDVRTPPENVEALRDGFANHAHVVVINAGHGGRELMAPEYRDLLQAFLRGERAESCTITLPFIFAEFE